jgi:large-conductance mechanosensitive channel
MINKIHNKVSKIRGNGSWCSIFYIVITIGFSKFIDKVVNFVLYVLLVFFLVNIESACVNRENRDCGETLEPLLMPLMDFLEII